MYRINYNYKLYIFYIYIWLICAHLFTSTIQRESAHEYNTHIHRCIHLQIFKKKTRKNFFSNEESL